MANWGVQHDGTTLTPAPGMLTESEGLWLILISHPDDIPDGAECGTYLDDDDPLGDAEECYTYLAPAPTPGGLLIALAPLGDVVADMVVIHHGGGFRSWVYNNDGGAVSFKGDAFELFDLALLDSVLQHHRALLAYCNQEGWQCA